MREHTLMRMGGIVVGVCAVVLLVGASSAGQAPLGEGAVLDSRPSPRAAVPAAVRGGACVWCDRCSGGAENSHQTGTGGARTGADHPCFEGVEGCTYVHVLTTGCGGGEEENGQASGSETIGWETLASDDGAEIEHFLLKHPESWRFNAHLDALQWYTCDGQLAASLPATRAQIEIVGRVLDRLRVGAGQD